MIAYSSIWLMLLTSCSSKGSRKAGGINCSGLCVHFVDISREVQDNIMKDYLGK